MARTTDTSAVVSPGDAAPMPDLRYFADIFRAQADDWFATLRTDIAWQQHEPVIFGRRVKAPRLSAWHGDAGIRYRYSGITLDALPWTPTLAVIRDAVQAAVAHEFNSVLLNLYRDGADAMGWHSDDEAELGVDPVIASVSLGACRRFSLRHRTRREVGRIDLDLAHGSLLLMAGQTQRCWQHCLPRSRRIDAPRINLTFRRIVGV